MPGYLPKPPYPVLNHAHPLAKGLVLCMPFHEQRGSTVYDLSGYGNDGTPAGGVTKIDTPFGGGLDFDGVDGNISADPVSLPAGDLTISVWVRHTGAITDINTYPGIVCQGGFEYDEGVEILLNRDNTVVGAIGEWAVAVGDSALFSDDVLVQNILYNLVFTLNSDNGKMYNNCNLIKDVTLETYTATTEPLYIGRRDPGTTRPGFWDGIIDNVMIWNRALSQEEIAQLYHDPFTMFRFPYNTYNYLPFFPTIGLEVLHPIQPITRTNKIAFRQDSRTWASTQKSGSEWHHEICTIRFRIQAAYMSAMLNFLEGYKAAKSILNLPGIQPFIRVSETNLVYIVDYTSPQRDTERPMHYLFSVTFMRTDA